jgi:SAM-dependent methyltransferase
MAAGNAEPSACRLCGGTQLESLGTITDSDYFAGNVLPQPIAGGGLWRCCRCESLFRHPILTSESYLRLYEAGASGQWQGNESRRDLPLIRHIIAKRPRTRNVLDVGCGTGDFLASLPGTLAKSGIEPSVQAAARAVTRGIVIAAASLEHLPLEQRFDVITLIDVIEHVPEPAPLLQLAARHLCPDGMIIVSTGDPQSAAWRVFGARFWYATFPEHVSFPSSRFFELWQADNGGGSINKLATRYQRLSPAKGVLYAVIQAGYFLSPSLFHRVGRIVELFARRGSRRRRYFAPSAPGLFVDHQVVTLQCATVVARENRKSA